MIELQTLMPRTLSGLERGGSQGNYQEVPRKEWSPRPLQKYLPQRVVLGCTCAPCLGANKSRQGQRQAAQQTVGESILALAEQQQFCAGDRVHDSKLSQSQAAIDSAHGSEFWRPDIHDEEVAIRENRVVNCPGSLTVGWSSGGHISPTVDFGRARPAMAPV